jgi:hypothetical protein
MNDLFLTAVKGKFRFPSASGLLSVEDLFDLPLTGKGANLDDIARGLHKSLKESDGDISFVRPAVKTTADLQVKLDIVKYVIEVKIAERDTRAAAEEKAATKQRLMAKLAEKKDKALDELSTDQIQAMLNEL